MAFGAQGKRAGPLRNHIYLSDLKSALMASARATSAIKECVVLCPPAAQPGGRGVTG